LATRQRYLAHTFSILSLISPNQVSAKVGLGIDEVLEAIVKRVPPPKNTVEKPLRALIYDSYYDAYRGVICQFRVVDGTVRRNDCLFLSLSLSLSSLLSLSVCLCVCALCAKEINVDALKEIRNSF
jgi:translation elongation factor EF-4